MIGFKIFDNIIGLTFNDVNNDWFLRKYLKGKELIIIINNSHVGNLHLSLRNPNDYPLWHIHQD